MTRLQAIIFDLDDTLYLERDYVLSGFRAVAGWLATQQALTADDLYSFLAGCFEKGIRGNTFDLLVEKLPLEQEGLVDELVRLYREHKPRISPSPEVPGLLASLAERFALGLVTDGSSSTQRRKLQALGLTEYFSSLIISDELSGKVRKPSPLPFQVALEELGVAPEKAVYIADNPTKDFLGARRAGVSSVRVRRHLGLYSHLAPPDWRHEPNLEVTDLTDLESLLADMAPPH